MTANVEPSLMVKIVDPFCEGELEESPGIYYTLSPLIPGMSIDTNTVPVKEAVCLCGTAAGPVSHPLDDLVAGKISKFLEVLETYA
jgi:dihydrodipicolinate synthase/N-acetylneuraminate lyase